MSRWSSESDLWQAIRRYASAFGDFVRVENRVGPGTPDVNFRTKSREGWVELKFSPKEFEMTSTPTVENYEPAQAIWHRRRRLYGGEAWVLIGSPSGLVLQV